MIRGSNQDQLDGRIRLVDEHLRAENEHNLDAIMATFGHNPRFNLNGVALNDADSIRGMYDGFGFGGQGSFSNIKVEVKQQHISDESIVVELMLRGKHTDSFQAIAATNREFEIPVCAIFDFDEEGKLAGERVYFDGALLLQQLGILA
jgi:SnoaL-like polyketide cyclase